MLKRFVISMICLFVLINLSIASSNNIPSTVNFKINSKTIENLKTLFQSHFYHRKILPSVDIGQWITLRQIYDDGQVIDTFDVAQVVFDSSGFGLDADTCWTDSLIMEKIYDPFNGYYYMLDNSLGFHYLPNHRFRFRAKGRGSVPQFSDSIHSPIHDVHIIYPEPNDTIIRGESLAIKWIPQNEHNIIIEVVDLANNYLIYYPLIDNGSYTISASAFDSLVSGRLIFAVGRLDYTISYPGFLFIALTGVLNGLPLELQNAPGIEQTQELSGIKTINNPFATSYICYNQSHSAPLHLQIYDVTGKKIRDIIEQGQLKGIIYWDRKNENGKLVGKGIYIYKLKTIDKDFYGKFIIIR